MDYLARAEQLAGRLGEIRKDLHRHPETGNHEFYTSSLIEKTLKDLWKLSGLPLKRFFNTSGMIYRELELSKKLPGMSEDEQINLLASDGMLVKRPLAVGDDFVLVGFKESEWAEKI